MLEDCTHNSIRERSARERARRGSFLHRAEAPVAFGVTGRAVVQSINSTAEHSHVSARHCEVSLHGHDAGAQTADSVYGPQFASVRRIGAPEALDLLRQGVEGKGDIVEVKLPLV